MYIQIHTYKYKSQLILKIAQNYNGTITRMLSPIVDKKLIKITTFVIRINLVFF